MKTLLRYYPCFLLLALWEISARAHWVDTRFFPGPVTILLGGWDAFFVPGAKLPGHTLASLGRLGLGVLIAAPAATLLGLAMGLHGGIRGFFAPLVAVLYPVPKLAVYPLLLILFGLGAASKVAIIAFGVFFLVLLQVLHGVDRLRGLGYFDLARVYRIPWWRTTFQIAFLGIRPELLEGLKTGFGYGLVMMVAGEFTLAQTGIGVFMWTGWDQYRILDVYIGLFLVSLLGLAAFFLLDWLKARLPAG